MCVCNESIKSPFCESEACQTILGYRNKMGRLAVILFGETGNNVTDEQVIEKAGDVVSFLKAERDQRDEIVASLSSSPYFITGYIVHKGTLHVFTDTEMMRAEFFPGCDWSKAEWLGRMVVDQPIVSEAKEANR
jgi:hypothetical protein